MSKFDDDKKNTGDLSLADLLSQQNTVPENEENTSLDQTEDEQGSGLINLAAMVSSGTLSTSSQQTHQNSQAPGQSSLSQPPAAGFTNEGMPRESGFPGQTMPAQNFEPQAPKKSKAGIIVLIAIALLIGIGGIVFALTQTSGDSENTKLAQMEAELAALLAQARSEENAELRKELEDQIASQKAQMGETPEGSLSEDDEEIMEIEIDEIDEATGETTTQKVTTRRPRARTTAPQPKAPEPAKTQEKTTDLAQSLTAQKSATTTQKTEASPKTSELDSLLKGGGAQASSGGGLPDTPTAQQVNQVMSKVAAQARNVCNAPGSTVRIRIIVGSNGVVRDAVPTGEHATNALGRCVAQIARGTARFPQFKNPTFTFTYPVKI